MRMYYVYYVVKRTLYRLGTNSPLSITKDGSYFEKLCPNCVLPTQSLY